MRRMAVWVTVIALLLSFGWGSDRVNAQSLAQSEVAVMPGGQSIGIKLHSSGVLVVGYHFIHVGRRLLSPGEQANIRIGDLITKVDGQKIARVERVAEQIKNSGTTGHTLTLEFKRKGQILSTSVKPLWDEDTGTYRIGVYIRDSASGVGTLTFYDPQSRAFAALGHVVTDNDTGLAMEGRGEIVRASVTSIDRGESGQPGEKRGTFVDEQHTLGTISNNNEYGVYGFLRGTPDPSLITSPISIAAPQDVKPGPAQILTVIHGQRVEAFDVSIIKVNAQRTAGIKSFVVQVTDPRLLQATGGIVQGMSGSPVIENHRLVGAVTHVFLSDPTRGYGVFAAWMRDNARSVRPAA